MSKMKEVYSDLEVYSSLLRGEVYVDYKGERILAIQDVPRKVCKHDDLCHSYVMDNYQDVISDLIFAVDNS